MRLSAALDAALLRVSPDLGSFVDVEIVRA
jgi:hypothetical protein